MEEPPADSTDGSSIKPVSSLRNHFEKMLNARGPPAASSPAITRQAPPQAHSRLEEPEEPQPRFTGRISLDVPRSDGPQTSSSHISPARLAGPLTPDVRSTHSPFFATPKPRPISMGPLSPPRSPPLVTVDSPRSPPKPSNQMHAPNPSPTMTATPGSSTTSRSGSPQLNGLRHVRTPSRSPTPGIEARQAPFLSATTPAPTTTDPLKPSPSAKSPVSNNMNPPPPPINRAGKPKIISNHPSVTGRAFSDALAPDKSLELPDERISPFSTPPSSAESSPDPSPPSAHERSRPRAQAGAISRDSYFGSPAVHRSAPPKPKVQASATLPIAVHDKDPKATPSSTSIASDSPDDRPGLPPRHETRPVQIRSISRPPPPEPPVRRSTESSRRSTDLLARPITTAKEGGSQFMPPPKRIQSLTSETRSQLVDSAAPIRSLTRSSTEIRRDPPVFHAPTRIYTDDSDDADHSTDRGATTLSGTTASSDFPDTSQANRRPPMFKRRPHEIPTKYDTRLLTVCGEFVCTTGYVTRVWSLLTGEQLMSLVHGDTTKVTAIAFKPAKNVEDEGTRLWLGTNTGEILEVDIPTQSVVITKGNAHPRREVVRIYRHAAEMWSLDDDGKLHVWPPDETGTPSLSQTPLSFRVPKGHSCSTTVGNQLWMATGKEIRVFQRNNDTSAFSEMLQKPLSQQNVGEATSCTTISSQPDRIYFGHTDGKITVFSKNDYSCLACMNVGPYKISSLVGVGDYLWAGYKTGMIYVYDTTSYPWKVKKDWHAHENPIAGIVVDPSSVWKLDRLQVVSLGTDNMVRLWDGMLTDDWLEQDMQEHDADFCDFREVTALVMTWNAGASKPGSLRHDERDANFFRDLLASKEPPDILVFGFQELVDLEDKKVTARSFFKSSKKKDATDHEHMAHQYRAWRDHLMRCLEDYMPSSESYTLLHTANLVGLFTCVFIKSSERVKIRDVRAAEVKLGMGGLHGNKGALIVRFIYDDSSLCFVNCHLAAGQTHTVNRNNDIATIMETAALPPELDPSDRLETFVGGGDGSMVLDHEICILNGDLNYRIDAMPRDTVIAAVKANNLTKLLERDQLLLSRKRNPGFRLRAFTESPITFAPTYKYDVGTDNYDSSEKKRSPAWCDRLLYRGIGRIKQLDYQRHEVRVSDHRPVSGRFKIRIKTISPKRRLLVQQQSEERFETVKQRIAIDTKLDYLVNVFGMSLKEAQRLLKV